MTIKVRHINEIDISQIQFCQPKKTRSGSYLIEMYLLNNNQRENIYIQTPKLKNVDGIHFNETKAFIDFEFTHEKPELYQFFIDLDEKCIQETHKNSKKWFRKVLPLDVVEEYYKTNIKLGRNHHVPTIRFKLPVSKKEIQSEIYNQQRQQISYDVIKPDDELVNVIQVIGLKFLKQQFILETQLLQCKVYKTDKINKQLGYIIQDDEEDFDEDLLPNSLEENQTIFIDDEISLVLENDERENQQLTKIQEEEPEHETTENNEIENLENNIEEIDIQHIKQELTENDKQEINEELNNKKLLKKQKILQYNQHKIDEIRKEILDKQLTLEELEKDNQLFENPEYEYLSDDELLFDEIIEQSP